MTQVTVVKIGGRPQTDGRAAVEIAKAWRATGGQLTLVHGGGDEVSRLQRAFSSEPVFVGGRRVTQRADLELLRMALSGSANKRLVSQLVGLGVPAVGISGEDATLLTAVPADISTMGFTGHECAADVTLIRSLLAAGYLPVISPLARNRSCTPDSEPVLNVNGDDAAAAIAIALGASELLLISDVSHVQGGHSVLRGITAVEAESLVHDGSATGGMAAKLEAAAYAVSRGVRQVRISDIDALSDAARGTVISAAPESSLLAAGVQ
jgi:acetylglutamate kinase